MFKKSSKALSDGRKMDSQESTPLGLGFLSKGLKIFEKSPVPSHLVLAAGFGLNHSQLANSIERISADLQGMWVYGI